MKINNKAGISETFAAVPELKKVHILPDGNHTFNEDHAKRLTPKGSKYTTLEADAKELQEVAK